MTYAHLTTALLLMVGLGLVVWDVLVAFCNDEPNEDDTISGIVLKAARRCSGVPFAFGVLMGHLFVDQPWVRVGQPWAALWLVACTAFLTLLFHHLKFRYAAWVCLPLGIVAGAGLWPQ